MKTDPRYLLAKFISDHSSSTVMKDGGATNFKLGIFSNMADNLTEVMYINCTGGLTCCWRIHGNE